MKKNKMMRLASVLLVLTLLSTSVISGTFAKYTTTDSVEDVARVAYWGFGKATDIEFDLFSTSYSTDVKSADSDNVVAPGTSQSTKFAFKYTSNTQDNITAPEVKYTVSVVPTITNENKNATNNLDANPNFVWTLKAANADNATEYATLAQLEAAIKALSGDASGTKTYEPGKLPAALAGGETSVSGDQEVIIGWEWKFETADDTTTTDKNEMAIQDAFDTAMGNMDPLESVKIVIAITATQVND